MRASDLVTVRSAPDNSRLSAKAGDIIFIQQEPTIGIIMARNNLLRLEDYVGKYHVKMLKPGTMLKTGK